MLTRQETERVEQADASRPNLLLSVIRHHFIPRESFQTSEREGNSHSRCQQSRSSMGAPQNLAHGDYAVHFELWLHQNTPQMQTPTIEGVHYCESYLP